jgi:hypothetical protein
MVLLSTFYTLDRGAIFCIILSRVMAAVLPAPLSQRIQFIISITKHSRVPVFELFNLTAFF